MTAASTIGEGEVLLATIRYLITRGTITYRVSAPTGQGIDTEATKTEVRRIYEAEGIGRLSGNLQNSR